MVRAIRWTGAAVLTVMLLVVLTITLFGWNWLRGPIERFTLQKTGRELAINGNLLVNFDWPLARMHAASVDFANPSWAQERQMVSAEGVEISVDLLELIRQKVTFPEVRLEHAAVFLERSHEGRKSWLLDLDQQDEGARIHIGSVALEHGTVGYEDVGQKTRIRAELTTVAKVGNASETGGLQFSAQGSYKGLVVKAQGTGGPLLALRDTSKPYAIAMDATLGPTNVHVAGAITGLVTFLAVDAQLSVRGGSLEQLYPLLGMAFPRTRSYALKGHLLHAGENWRYEDFSGTIGRSDIAGLAQVITGGLRPVLSASLNSKFLALDDLGPLVGSRVGKTASTTKQSLAQERVLPDMPFNFERWDTVDAEVQLDAKALLRTKANPLQNMLVHLSLRDSVLTIDPLTFSLAGGQLNARVTLDGRSNPIRAHALVHARRVNLAKLFPSDSVSKGSAGQIHGDFDMTGSGNSIGTMLASANGKLSVVVEGGQISKMLMEKAGLHLWEMLTLSLTGDRLVTLHCGVADFDVKQGRMQATALIFDTQVTTIFGTGSIDLAKEQLNLVLNPKTKKTSPLALRSPIYVAGSFAQPKVGVDIGLLTARALGTAALGLLNPLLTLIPLVDAGPGEESNCGRLVRNTKVWPNGNPTPGVQ
jgi:AsmA protein